jgi:hypothetical protein
MESMDSEDPVKFYHELFNIMDIGEKGYLEIRDIR